MLEVASFWLLLCLPGYALLRRFSPASLETGALGDIALSYLATFVLLTPVSLAGYLFHLPLALLSGAIVGSIIASAAWLGRGLLRARPRMPKLSPLAILVSAVIAADMLLGLRNGSHMRGDGQYHMARVRLLLSYGFNDFDPLLAGGREQVYHTNLYHALIAASAQLARLEAPDAWVVTWFWAKLAAVGAVYYLAWTLLGQRWLAWVVALAWVIANAPSAQLPYPNNIALYWLLALSLAFAVQAFCGHGGFRPAIGLSAVSLALVQVHGLYFVFAIIVVAPLLLLRLLGLSIHRRLGRREVLAALLALGCGGPWLGWDVWQHVRTSAVAAPSPVASATSNAAADAREPSHERDWRSKGFVSLQGGKLKLDTAGFWDLGGTNAQLLLALLAGLLSRRKWQFAAFGLAVSVVLAALYVPQLCTPLVRVAGAPWIVRRMVGIVALSHSVVFPMALWLPVVERFSRPWLQAIVLAASACFAWRYGLNSGLWTRRKFFAHTANAAELRRLLTWHAKRHALFDSVIPRGAVVVAPIRDPFEFMALFVDCDCYPLAVLARHGTRGRSDMPARTHAVNVLLGSSAPLSRRLALLRTYGVKQLVFTQRTRLTPRAAIAYQSIATSVARVGGVTVLTLEPGRQPPR